MTARLPLAYVAVAGSCLVLHNVILITADFAGLPLGVAVLLSFTAVAGSGYVLHASFTFRQPLAMAGLLRYGAAMSANIPLAFVATWLWHVQINLPMPQAAPIASGCMLVFNFILGRWAITAPTRAVDTQCH
jgi:putative flippase GtrA